MVDAPWRNSPDEGRRIALLLWLADQGGHGAFIELSPFYGDDEARADEAWLDSDTFERRGWTNPANGGGLAGIAAALTPEGRVEAATVRRARTDKARRRSDCAMA